MKKIIIAVMLVSLLLVALPAVAAETDDTQTEGFSRMMNTKKARGWLGFEHAKPSIEPNPEALEERINQAVEEGKLTQERADEMLEKLEAGEFPLRVRVLDRDPEAIKEHIEQAVEEGKLTQERANGLLERLEEGLPLRGPGIKGLGGRGPHLDVELDA